MLTKNVFITVQKIDRFKDPILMKEVGNNEKSFCLSDLPQNKIF